jgi:hypothetical protein
VIKKNDMTYDFIIRHCFRTDGKMTQISEFDEYEYDSEDVSEEEEEEDEGEDKLEEETKDEPAKREKLPVRYVTPT